MTRIREEVTVTGGRIEGVEHANGLHTYLGIPYAAPPVGNLRWAPPAPVEPWSGTRAATRPGPQCLQPVDLGDFYTSRRDRVGEDCLYLNVWTRAASSDDALPVMVWIHGGALLWGSGEVYPGDRLSEKGVVVVTINYRLGPFGFFSHPELTAENDGLGSGNQGIRDQIAVLHWVQDNIRRFGGDPNNVTLFGESAGSWCLSVLQASPMARGLFHKVIGQSGARFLPLPYRDQETGYAPSAESRGKRLAEVFAPGEKLDLCGLRALPAVQIMDAYQREPISLSSFDELVIVDGPVLPGQVYEIFSRGDQAGTPALLGSTEDEAATINPDAINPATSDALDYVALARGSVETLLPEVGDAVFELYRIGSQAQARQSYFDFQTDVYFTQPMRVWANAMTNVGIPAYLYWWNWHPSIGGSTRLGAFHGAEIPYVFGALGERSPFGFKVDEIPREQAFADLMMTAWTNFAKTGNPSIAGVVDWPAHAPDKPSYVVLGPNIHVIGSLRDERVELISRAYERRHAGMRQQRTRQLLE